MTVTGKAALAGVLGWPIAHSLSPALHGYWIEKLKLDAAYVPLAVPAHMFDEAVTVLSKVGFRGANVTLPHKERAFQLAQVRSASAEATRAVNTLVFRDGVIEGNNTDVEGFLAALDDAAAPELTGKAIMVLGAGGAARAVVFALLSRSVGKIFLMNRTRARADEIAAEFGDRVQSIDWRDRPAELEACDLLVNTTSLGMVGQPDLEIELSGMKTGGSVCDIVYRPLETKLIVKAKRRGLKVVDGLGMLMHQARAGFSSWFGESPAVTDDLRRYLLKLL